MTTETETTPVDPNAIDPAAVNSAQPNLSAAPQQEPTQEQQPAPEQPVQEPETEQPADPAPEDQDGSGAEWDGKDYVQLEHPSGQAAIDVLKEAGVPPAEANALFEKALKSGNLEDVDWAKLETLIGASKTVLVKTGVEAYNNEVHKETLKTVEYAYELMGSKDNWEKVSKWAKAKEKSDAKFKPVVDGIRKGIEANGHLSQIALKELKNLYESDPKNNSLGAEKALVTGDKGAAPVEPLSRREYGDLLLKASNPMSRTTDAELAVLRARRNAGIKAGI